ncbi:hypothetical protein IEQ34_016025 [Dendrobium chrysotoxum]|uniref:Carbohydrate kinase PfkB domain-containing protein n=1 Tax=Dendrobium chrysotoxum TaxID=161865 RepID=A0AAV7GCY4_DENCH|nr:hypothetical protein IEQ34_016025 [Dendrobium chrysotoxum]
MPLVESSYFPVQPHRSLRIQSFQRLAATHSSLQLRTVLLWSFLSEKRRPWKPRFKEKRKAKIFHYGALSPITKPRKSAHVAATKAAKDAGVLLSYDPNLRLPLWPSAESAREGILSIWDAADIIQINEEISFLARGENPYDDAVVHKLFHLNLKL